MILIFGVRWSVYVGLVTIAGLLLLAPLLGLPLEVLPSPLPLDPPVEPLVAPFIAGLTLPLPAAFSLIM